MAVPLGPSNSSPPHLVRDLNLVHALAINVGTVIGTGIFLVPKTIAESVGSPGAILAVWLLASFLAFLGALTYAELGASLPAAGGDYIYLRDAFGRRAGFLFGWTQLLVARSGSIAALATGFGIYLGNFLDLNPFTTRLAALGAVALLTAVNVAGVRRGGHVQAFFAALKVGALAALIGFAFTAEAGRTENFLPIFPPELQLGFIGAFGLALVDALWAYDGWNDVNLAAGEVARPERNIHRAMMGSMTLIMTIYLLANLAYLYVLPSGVQAGSETGVASDVARAALGPSGARFISLAILVSMFGALNGSILTGARIFYAMAADGLFFRIFSSVHPRFRTPAVALVGQASWAALLILSGTYRQLTTYVIFASWVFYGLSALALIRLRRLRPELERPYLSWGYPWTQMVFAVAAGGLILNTLVSAPLESFIGLGIILIGLPVYAAWGHQTRPAKA